MSFLGDEVAATQLLTLVESLPLRLSFGPVFLLHSSDGAHLSTRDGGGSPGLESTMVSAVAMGFLASLNLHSADVTVIS